MPFLVRTAPCPSMVAVSSTSFPPLPFTGLIATYPTRGCTEYQHKFSGTWLPFRVYAMNQHSMRCLHRVPASDVTFGLLVIEPTLPHISGCDRGSTSGPFVVKHLHTSHLHQRRSCQQRTGIPFSRVLVVTSHARLHLQSSKIATHYLHQPLFEKD